MRSLSNTFHLHQKNVLLTLLVCVILMACNLTPTKAICLGIYSLNIPPILCQAMGGVTFRILTYVTAHQIIVIFQQSLFQFKFPIAWKHAIAQPVYKRKGDKTVPYRIDP